MSGVQGDTCLWFYGEMYTCEAWTVRLCGVREKKL